MTEMADKLQLLHPEIALFAATCLVLVLGVSKNAAVRGMCWWVTALALLAAAWLGFHSPGPEAPGLAKTLFPHLLPYAKTVIALMGLLLLLVLGKTVDVDYERDVARKGNFEALRTTRGEFYAFFLFSLTGVMLCTTADDLIWIFLALELTSLPTYIMVAMSSHRLRSQEAGVKYFFLGAFGAACFLYGFSLIYGVTGSTNLREMSNVLSAQDSMNPLAVLGYVLAIVGVSFKISAAPMHFYTPDVYQGAATPVSAFLAFAPKMAGFLVLMMLIATLDWTHGVSATSLPEPIRITLWIMAALTMTVGNVLALLQTNIKRMLAYSSVAHSGYILVGLIAGPTKEIGKTASDGLAASMFYLLCYGVMTIGAFAVVAALNKHSASTGEETEIETLSDIRGLCSSHPFLGWALVLCVLSLLGFPPFLGFWAKLTIVMSGLAAGEVVLVVVLVLNSAISAFYYLRIIRAALLERRDDSEPVPYLVTGTGRSFAAGLCAALVVVLVVTVSALFTFSDNATTIGVRGKSAFNTQRSAAGPAQTPISDKIVRAE